jgi:hypothetical protein
MNRSLKNVALLIRSTGKKKTTYLWDIVTRYATSMLINIIYTDFNY